MKISTVVTSALIFATAAAGFGQIVPTTHAATAGAIINVVQKKTAKHDAKVRFCNTMNQSVDVWIGQPGNENGQYARVWAHKCHTFKTPRTKLGFDEYTKTDAFSARGVINTKTGSVTYRF